LFVDFRNRELKNLSEQSCKNANETTILKQLYIQIKITIKNRYAAMRNQS
jgi:hypothetical protein